MTEIILYEQNLIRTLTSFCDLKEAHGAIPSGLVTMIIPRDPRVDPGLEHGTDSKKVLE